MRQKKVAAQQHWNELFGEGEKKKKKKKKASISQASRYEKHEVGNEDERFFGPALASVAVTSAS